MNNDILQIFYNFTLNFLREYGNTKVQVSNIINESNQFSPYKTNTSSVCIKEG